jgi:2-amino-4-hydroxy-6-hydroxymethyldihydropteridine diphosphokinase
VTEIPFAVALGASLGDAPRAIALATNALAVTPGVRLTGRSRVYRTPPAGGVARGWFHNAVVAGVTTLSPHALLARCREIEQRLGRLAARRWADRAIDLDVLLHGDAVLTDPALTLPHPRMRERDFVLVPLADAWLAARDPRDGARFAELPAARRRLVAVGLLRR